MTTQQKRPRLATAWMATDALSDAEYIDVPASHNTQDLADGYEFLVPNELGSLAIGILHCLISKRVISVSFTNLYSRSLKDEWLNIFIRERKNLKSNINSIEKCFMLNRLIAEYKKNPVDFIRRTTELNDQIKRRMSCTAISSMSVDNWHRQVLAWQDLQCQQRLFHTTDQHHSCSLITLIDLQRVTTQLYCQAILDNDHFTLRKMLQNCFIITIQPSIPECAAATKYEKYGNIYVAKLTARILCLLDVEQIPSSASISPIGVTLLISDPQVHEPGEEQVALQWKRHTILDSNGVSRTFLYAQLESIKLKKLDQRNSRPLYSSKLCRLQFQMKIKMNSFPIEEDLIFLSRSFGLCSHAQYFPEQVAKVFLYEFDYQSRSMNAVQSFSLLIDYISRYYVRVIGVQILPDTTLFLLKELQTNHNVTKNENNSQLSSIYEGILAKMLSQMEFFVDHPFLSMMYQDGLFLGIYDSAIDNHLKGTRDQPEILLRFNTLTTHQPTQQASVRYIIHHGQLTKAAFHLKAFVDEMCRLIYESNDDTIIVPRIRSTVPNRTFRDFKMYFDEELIRLSTISPAKEEAYKPIIPVLWSTMRIQDDDQVPSRKTEFGVKAEGTGSPKVSHTHHTRSVTNFKHLQSNIIPTDPYLSNDEKDTAAEKNLIYLLAEHISEILIQHQMETETIDRASALQASIKKFGKLERTQLIALLHNYLQSKGDVQASKQTPAERNDERSYKSFCAPFGT